MFFKIFFLFPYLIYKIVFKRKSRFKQVGFLFSLFVFIFYTLIYSLPISYAFFKPDEYSQSTTVTTEMAFTPLATLALISLISTSIEASRIKQATQTTEELAEYQITLEGYPINNNNNNNNNINNKSNNNKSNNNDNDDNNIDNFHHDLLPQYNSFNLNDSGNSDQNQLNQEQQQQQKLKSRSSGKGLLKMIVNSQMKLVENSRGVEFLTIPLLFAIGFCLIPFFGRLIRNEKVLELNNNYQKYMLISNFFTMFCLWLLFFIMCSVSIEIYKRQLWFQSTFTNMASVSLENRKFLPKITFTKVSNLISWIKIRSYIVSHILLPWTSAQITLSYIFALVVLLTLIVIVRIWSETLKSTTTLRLIYLLFTCNFYIIWAVMLGTNITHVEERGITTLLKEQLKFSFEIRKLEKSKKKMDFQEKQNINEKRDIIKILSILIQILEEENKTKHILSFSVSEGSLKLLIALFCSSASALISHFALKK
ncbi:nf-kappa-b-repressing factor-related [Anaeramoeba flamelloides]|uniref:Nf-kappa-b-repressing factor-related n=1 Tax=Anaeramoeba flamelloides TaxID=1746091 RepID=A0AAV7YPW2_9EUKA|nr:nf-kappa-b-repressing factor-related [Anaeramoeba flamelloides]